MYMCMTDDHTAYLPPPHDPLLLGARVLGLPERVRLGAQGLLGRPQGTLCGSELIVGRSSLYIVD